MSETVYNVLFVCTGNSARSILAEAVLNRLGRGRFRAYSAGSHPRGSVHPLTLETLRNLHYSVDGLRSKAWNEFARPGAPELSFIFTVCDKAAGEACPVWPGQPMTAHWGVEDPAAAAGDEATQRAAFKRALMLLSRRIELFLSLPLDKIDSLALRTRLDSIGKAE